jgi:phosphoenolpyruvate synthase/pyruvate phosphate dikinase
VTMRAEGPLSGGRQPRSMGRMSAPLLLPFALGDASMADLLGGKGANLAEMTRLGLPVPPGFTITTEACREFLKNGAVPKGIPGLVSTAVGQLEAQSGRIFGSVSDPLLVSVRSGGKFSMPGMMETVLNPGPSRAARRSHHCGLPVVERRPSQDVSGPSRHRGLAGDGGQRR